MAKKTEPPRGSIKGQKQLPPAGGALGDAAETVGASLGNLLNQVEARVRTAKAQRDSTIKTLLAIRDKANRLLADLGHAIPVAGVIGRRNKRKGAVKTEGSPVPPIVKRGARRLKEQGGMSPENRARNAEAQKARSARLKAAKKAGTG